MAEKMLAGALYKEIKKAILDEVVEGVLKVGDKVPTEKELMDQYQVSRITVVKALTELKQEGIVERYAGKGTYVVRVPSSTEETKPSSNVQSITLVLTRLSDMFSLNMIRGITDYLDKKIIFSIIQTNGTDHENIVIQREIEKGTQGIIVVPSEQEYYSDQVLYMHVTKYPFVLLDRYFSRIDSNYVVCDGFVGGEMICNHFWENGHTKVAFVSTANTQLSSSSARLKGFSEACRAHKEMTFFSINAQEITQDPDKYYSVFKELVMEKGVTAFAVGQSMPAIVLKKLLGEMGVSVPEDVSLACFDNPYPKEESNFFTYIDQNEYLMGQKAADLILKVIENPTRTPEKICLVPTLVESYSTRKIKK